MYTHQLIRCMVLQAAEAETTYKACVVEANNRQHELEKVKVRNDFYPVVRISFA